MNARNQEIVQVQQDRMMQSKEHIPHPYKFKIGDYVLVRKPIIKSKLDPKWIGPYIIVQTGPYNAYQLKSMNEHLLPTWISGRRLKIYLQRSG